VSKLPLLTANQDDMLLKIPVIDQGLNLNSFESIPISKKSCKEKITACFKGRGDKFLMITPCKHVFHPDCLKIWGERKNECPVCRKEIPCIE
jgi:hypothetical protein